MTDYYSLTQKQSLLLRSLGHRNIEASSMELAVDALLPLNDVEVYLSDLSKGGLVRTYSVADPSAEQVYELTTDGRAVVRALDPIKGTPTVGSYARLSHGKLLGWLTGQKPKYVQIVSDTSA